MAVEERALPPKTTRAAATPLQGRIRLVVLSALMLFVELILIRWPAESNIYLRYLTNLVLLASSSASAWDSSARMRSATSSPTPRSHSLSSTRHRSVPGAASQPGRRAGASRARRVPCPPTLGFVASGLRGIRRGHGAHRRGCWAHVPDVRGPAGLSPRRARQYHRDRGLQRAGVPGDASDRVDPARLHRDAPRARSADHAGAGRLARGVAAGLRSELAVGGRRVVALLQGHHDPEKRGKDRAACERTRTPVDVSPGSAPSPPAVLRLRVCPRPCRPTRSCARRRCRQRERRRGCPRARSTSRGCGRDRPCAPDQRQVLASREPLWRCTRRSVHRRRTGVPRAHQLSLRPDRLRAPGLDDARLGTGGTAARELPLHPRGLRDRSRATDGRRRLLDVQLLSAFCLRALREHTHSGVRRRALLRPRAPEGQWSPHAGGPHRRARWPG
jgi:hypothetical protein